MSLEADFTAAADSIKNLTSKPEDTELLELYALYKQATHGDNDTARPGMLDFKGKAKWDAWTEKSGKSKEDAMKEYIAFANTLKTKYA